MISQNQVCEDCANAYPGSDNALRCRVHSSGLKCSPAAAEGCRKWEREPVADAEESPWFKGAWLCDMEGRN